MGLLFIKFQFDAWAQLVAQGVYLGGNQSNASGSFLYVLSGLHLAHIVGGLLALLFTTFMALRKKYNAENMAGIESFSIFWHFLGCFRL